MRGNSGSNLSRCDFGDEAAYWPDAVQRNESGQAGAVFRIPRARLRGLFSRWRVGLDTLIWGNWLPAKYMRGMAREIHLYV